MNNSCQYTNTPASDPVFPDLHVTPQQRIPPTARRLPPHSIEAEQAVLGCMLLEPVEGINLFLERLGHIPDVFYDVRHRTIFETMLAMSNRGDPIDIVSLSLRLRDSGCIEQAGGQQYIAQLPDTVGAPASIEFYLEVVRDHHLRRRLLQACATGAEMAFDQSKEIRELLDRVEQQVLQINGERLDLPEGMQKLTKAAVQRAEFLHEHGGDPTGIQSGFPDLDCLTGGFHGGEMIVIAARPSVGKTALAMNIAEHVAVTNSLPTAVFSLEMSAEALVMRLLCSRARVNLAHLRDRLAGTEELRHMREVAEKLAAAPLYIDDTPGLSILELKARARRLRQKHRIALFIVDYLQLCRPDQTRPDSRQQEIAEVSHGLKALARELKAPIIVVSQLNRELEKSEKPRKPQLSDLRESGAIEQDADIVGLLYKWKDEDLISAIPDAKDGQFQVVHLLLAKHRNGPTGDIPLCFQKGCTRFESYASPKTIDVLKPRKPMPVVDMPVGQP